MKEKEFNYINTSLDGYSELEKRKQRKLKKLIEAIQNDDKETILNLKEENVSFSDVFANIATPLMIATSKNNQDMVNFLLDNGANPATILKSGKDVAFLALEMGNSSLFKLFISKGVLINLKYNNKTRLMMAVENSDLVSVRALLHHGVNINEKDNEGRTALHYNFIKNPYTETDKTIGLLLTNVGLSPLEEDDLDIPAFGYLHNVNDVKSFVNIKSLPDLPDYKMERIEKVKEKEKPKRGVIADYEDVTVKKISRPKSFASYYAPKKSSGNKPKPTPKR